MEIVLHAFSPPPFTSEEQERQHCLCPVWALRVYISRTQGFRLCDQLFVCFANPVRDKALSKQRLSHWIVEVIAFAYSSKGLPSPVGLWAHSTRGMAVGLGGIPFHTGYRCFFNDMNLSYTPIPVSVCVQNVGTTEQQNIAPRDIVWEWDCFAVVPNKLHAAAWERWLTCIYIYIYKYLCIYFHISMRRFRWKGVSPQQNVCRTPQKQGKTLCLRAVNMTDCRLASVLIYRLNWLNPKRLWLSFSYLLWVSSSISPFMSNMFHKIRCSEWC